MPKAATTALLYYPCRFNGCNRVFIREKSREQHETDAKHTEGRDYRKPFASTNRSRALGLPAIVGGTTYTRHDTSTNAGTGHVSRAGSTRARG